MTRKDIFEALNVPETLDFSTISSSLLYLCKKKIWIPSGYLKKYNAFDSIYEF